MLRSCAPDSENTEGGGGGGLGKIELPLSESLTPGSQPRGTFAKLVDEAHRHAAIWIGTSMLDCLLRGPHACFAPCLELKILDTRNPFAIDRLKEITNF